MLDLYYNYPHFSLCKCEKILQLSIHKICRELIATSYKIQVEEKYVDHNQEQTYHDQILYALNLYDHID